MNLLSEKVYLLEEQIGMLIYVGLLILSNCLLLVLRIILRFTLTSATLVCPFPVLCLPSCIRIPILMLVSSLFLPSFVVRTDFNDVWHVFQELDADVISIEASKSDLKLLEVFKRNAYANDVGPGVYDIHSPRVPSVEELKNKIKEFIQAGIRKDRMVVNPDCGLKESPRWHSTWSS